MGLSIGNLVNDLRGDLFGNGGAPALAMAPPTQQPLPMERMAMAHMEPQQAAQPMTPQPMRPQQMAQGQPQPMQPQMQAPMQANGQEEVPGSPGMNPQQGAPSPMTLTGPLEYHPAVGFHLKMR